MIPVSLNLKNFMSYGQSAPELDFTRFRLACLSGPNGHGKSSLLDAITWALWGQARKASGSTKPDEGLLRIGARHMQVEFVFDLAGSRYRAIRNFEIRPSGRNKPGLEFQIFDPEEDRYISLSRPNLSQTQQLINETLRMDYDTFVNSSFLLQGRADEFTRKKPRERKEILAEILGLSRFDQLQALAREESRAIEKSLIESRVRNENIDQELKKKESLEQQKKEVETELKQVEKQLREVEKEVGDIQEKNRQTELVKARIAANEKNLERLRVALKEDRRQQEKVLLQHKKWEELLRRKDEIESNAKKFHQLQLEAEKMQKAGEERNQLEKDKNRLERKIDQSRHQLEKQLTQLAGRIESLDEQLQEIDSLVRHRTEIQGKVEKLKKTKTAIAALEEKEKQVQEIDLVREKLLRRLESEKATLISQIENLKEQYLEHRRKSDRIEGLKKKWVELEHRDKEYKKLDESLNVIRDEGQKLKSRLDTLQERMKQVESRSEQDRQDSRRIQETEEVQCPLCDSDLDESHKAEVIKKFQDRLEENSRQLEEWKRESKSLKQEISRLREKYKNGKEKIEGWDKVREERGRLQSELSEAENSREAMKQLETRGKTLREKLDNQDYARPVRTELRQADAKKKDLGFSAEKLKLLRGELETLSAFPEQLKKIEESEKKRAEIKKELDRKGKDKKEIQKKLEEKTFEPQARQQLNEVKEKIKNLEYDPDRFKELQDQLARLKDSPIHQSRLEEAVVEMPALEEDKRKIEERMKSRQAEGEKLKESIEGDNRLLAGTGTLPEQLEKALKSRKECSEIRDKLHSRFGGLMQQLEHLGRMEKERMEIRRHIRQQSGQKGLYDELVEAFGPNGAPALIIENAVPEIQNEANRIVDRLTAGRTRIAIESQREKKTGGAIETLDIKIGDEIGTRQYEMYSGGEAFRTDLAIRIALSRLLARRAGTRLQTLVIDEGFGTQDAEGLEAIVEVIREIAGEFEKILVVTHLDTLKNAFPARIEVTKEPESGSTFEVFV
jgi:DNA repair protein SbcC/Rad50